MMLRSEGLPVSSSPSRKNFTLTGQAPSTAKKLATVSSAMVVEPFTSEEPRANSLPSRTTGSNGGVSHSSRGSAGCTS